MPWKGLQSKESRDVIDAQGGAHRNNARASCRFEMKSFALTLFKLVSDDLRMMFYDFFDEPLGSKA